MAQDPYSIFSNGLAAPLVSPNAPSEIQGGFSDKTAPASTGYDIFSNGFGSAPAAEGSADDAEVQYVAQKNQLRSRTLEDLTADETFDPLTAYRAPEYNDPESQAKILEVYKAKQTAPVDFGKVALGIVPGVVHAGKAVGSAIGNVAGQVTNIASGDKARAASAVGELAAGVDTNITSLLYTLGKAGTFLKVRDGNGPKNDDEWRTLLLEQADFADAVADASRGEGTITKAMLGNSKYWGTIKDIVEDHGGSVDAKTVEEAAPILDPTILIPMLAGARSAGLVTKMADAGLAFKATETGIALVNAAGKELIVANEGSSLFKNLSKVADVPQFVEDNARLGLNTAVRPVAGALEATGKAATKTGEAISGAKNSAIGAVLGAGADLALTGVASGLPVGGLALGALAPKILKKGGNILTDTAGKLRGEVPLGPVAKQVVDTATGSLAKGAAAGVGLTGDPLAAGFTLLNVAGADNDEQRGEAIGGQAAFGAAGHLGAAAALKVKGLSDIAGQLLDAPKEGSQPIVSPEYGTVSELDTAHAAALNELPSGTQNLINQFREAVRTRGSQIYTVPRDMFVRAFVSFKAQEAAARGEKLTNEQLASYRDHATAEANAKGVLYENFDLGDGQKRKVIFLNTDGSALQHEGGHLLTALLEKKDYDSIAKEIRDRYTDDEKAEARARYENRIGSKISEDRLINEMMAENVAQILNAQPIERLGAPKPVARAIYQFLGKTLEDLGASPAGDRKTALGFRPDFGVGKLAENLLRAQEADARPVIGKAAKVDLSKVELNPVKPASDGMPNIRASRADQNRFQRATVDEGNARAAKAVDSNPNYTPENKASFVKLAAVLHQGGENPHPVEINYDSAETTEFNAGRDLRRAEQSLPENVRQQVQKVLLPERFEVRANNEVQIVGKSLDKIIGNAYRLAKDANANGVGHLVPYEHVDGVLTDRGWTELVKDVQTYTKNQANGRSGAGGTLVVPKGYLGELPALNEGYKPTALAQNKADYINMLMALPPPKTARKGQSKSGVDVNVIARTLADANAKEVLPSVTSKPGANEKFKERTGEDIGEFNPLRDEMAKAGVKVRDLLEVTERINLSRMKGEVKVRNDLDFSRPNTDMIRAGFMPDPAKPVRRTDREIDTVASEYTKAAGIPYTPHKGYAKIDPGLGKELADWYDSAKSDPNDPAVKAAYDALVAQTKAQYDAMTAAGYTAEPWTGKGEPYASSADMVKDVRDNKHLYFFKTENGFGDANTSTNNPLLADAGNGLVVNDLFRAVHDFFGHAKEGYEFGPRGEYNAFLAHSSMFDRAALPALGAETLSQNAWVNFGKHLRDAEGNIPAKGSPDFVPLQNRPFADQKVVAVPQDLLDRALAPEGETPAAKVGEKKTDFARYKEISAEMSRLVDEGKANSPEFYDLWAENEAIKNRNPDDRANPPTRDFAPEEATPPAPEPTAAFLVDTPVQHGAKKALPDAVDEKTLNLIHYGSAGMKELDPKQFGKSGLTSQSELAGAPRSYFYEQGAVNKNDPVTGRGALYGAKVSGSRIYDGDADTLGYSEFVNREKADQMLKDAGYVGIARSAGSGKGAYRQVELYDKTKVFPIEGPTSKFQPKEIDPNADPRKPEKKLAIPSKAGREALVNPPMDDTTYAVKPKDEPTAKNLPAEDPERAAKVTKLKEMATEIRELAAKSGGSMTRAEAEIFRTKSAAANKLRLEIARPLTPERVPSEAERQSTLPTDIVVQANHDFLSNKPAAEAILDAAIGVFHNADTAVDQIMNGDNPDVSAKEFYDTFQPTRDAMRKHYGDEIELFRAQGAQKEKATQNWATTEEFAKEFGPKVEKRNVPIDDVIAVNVGFNGKYHEVIVGEPPTASFKPAEQSELTLDKEARARTAEKKSTFPESIPVKYVKNEDGSLKLDKKGKPRVIKTDYDLSGTDLAKNAAKGVKGDEARADAISTAYADKLVQDHNRAVKNPALAAGADWYKIARTKIRAIFGDDSLLFAQLLGATSARTPVADNFRQSIDAYRKYKAGDYDKIIAKYKEGLAKEADGTLVAEMGAKTPEGALRAWIAEHDLVPRKSNGKRFNANSIQVLNVLAGVWAERTGGPKTPNFAGNLSGHTLAATIDVWAARNMRRLGSDPASRWRILPEAETGVSDADFHLAQAAYAKAAKRIGIDPDALQGILWFAEKEHWEKSGWTRAAQGKEKSDFNTFLKKTSRNGDEVILDEKSNQPTLL